MLLSPIDVPRYSPSAHHGRHAPPSPIIRIRVCVSVISVRGSHPPYIASGSPASSVYQRPLPMQNSRELYQVSETNGRVIDQPTRDFTAAHARRLPGASSGAEASHICLLSCVARRTDLIDGRLARYPAAYVRHSSSTCGETMWLEAARHRTDGEVAEGRRDMWRG